MLNISKMSYLRILKDCPSTLRFKHNLSTSRCYCEAAKKLVSIIEDQKKKVAIVMMQRPPVNSLNTDLLQALTVTVRELEEKKFKGMILSSNCPGVFSAGLDLTEMYNTTEDRLKIFWTSLQNMWKTLYLTPLITIAAVNGHAPAGGCLLAASCDYSLMVKSKGTIGLNEAAFGIVAPKWFRTLFINTIGSRRAEQALNIGKLFSTEEALAINLINELVENPSDLMPKSQQIMEQWLKVPEVARQATKIGLRKPLVDELISFEKAEVEETVKVILQDYTQKMLGKYVESLKAKTK